MIKLIYRLFPVIILLGVIELILHVFNVSIPIISIDPKIYKNIKENNTELRRYHKRHAISCLIVTPLIATVAVGNINILIRIICLLAAWLTIYIINSKDCR